MARFCNIPLMLLWLLAAWPAPAAAEPAPLDFKGIYEFGFSELPFGRLGIEIEQTADRYNVTTDIVTTGIVKIFVPHRSHSTAAGSGTAFSYPDITYDSRYRTKNKRRHVVMRREGGKLVEVSLTPPDPRRPQVEPSLRDAAFDPLSFVLAMRAVLAEQISSPLGEEGNFTLTVFDGRRLTEANFTVEGKRVIRYKGEKLPVVAVAVRRKLLAGFTASELKKHDPNEPTLYIYFTDNERLIPVKLEAHAWFGQLTATLVTQCDKPGACLLGVKE